MIIYVVFGQTGEYSDNQHWMVKAFRDEELAKQLVLDATKGAAEAYAKVCRSNWLRVKGGNPFDPDMKTDYTGTSYWYDEVELAE